MIKRNVLFGLILYIVLPPSAHAWNRIVTLNPMISEWTAEILGKEAALKKIVGATEYSNYPEYMKKVETVGPYPQLQSEKILSMNPDLVIASAEYNRPDQLEQLKKLKLNVVILPREEFSAMGAWIEQLGKALGEEKRATVMVQEWTHALAEIPSLSKKKKVFFQIQFLPLITVGKDSFLNAAFEKAGYENIFRDLPQAYPKVSKEAVLEKNPDEVMVFEMVKNQDDLEKVKDAWRKSLVRVFNGDDFARCSLRLLKAMKEVVHDQK